MNIDWPHYNGLCSAYAEYFAPQGCILPIGHDGDHRGDARNTETELFIEAQCHRRENEHDLA